MADAPSRRKECLYYNLFASRVLVQADLHRTAMLAKVYGFGGAADGAENRPCALIVSQL